MVIAASAPLYAQENSAAGSTTIPPIVDSSLYSAMRWRLIGPYRAGRVSAVTGVPGDPSTYYIGTPGGGVWKTTSGGVTWKPIFDDEHVASIGDIAIAPSNPKSSSSAPVNKPPATAFTAPPMPAPPGPTSA